MPLARSCRGSTPARRSGTMLPGLLLGGLGMALAMTPTTAAAMSSVPRRQGGRRLGGAEQHAPGRRLARDRGHGRDRRRVSATRSRTPARGRSRSWTASRWARGRGRDRRRRRGRRRGDHALSQPAAAAGRSARGAGAPGSSLNRHAAPAELQAGAADRQAVVRCRRQQSLVVGDEGVEDRGKRQRGGELDRVHCPGASPARALRHVRAARIAGERLDTPRERKSRRGRSVGRHA